MPIKGRFTKEQLHEFAQAFETSGMTMAAFIKTIPGLASSTFSSAVATYRKKDDKAKKAEHMRKYRAKKREEMKKMENISQLAAPTAEAIAQPEAARAPSKPRPLSSRKHNQLLRDENAALRQLLAVQWAIAAG